MKFPFRIIRWAGAGLTAMLAAAPVAAQTTPDALKGRSLFMTGGYSVTVSGGANCATCHIVANFNYNNVLNGSNEAHLRATLGTGSMIAFAPLRPNSVPDATHISVYLANPDSWLSKATMSFGSVALNTDSAVQTVTFGNTSQGTLVIKSMVISGTAASNYTLQTGSGYCVASGQSINAGDKCTVAVKFKPTAAGDRPATLKISHNQPDDTAFDTITLAGTGGAATASTLAWTTAATVDAGSVATGSTGSAATMTVKNSGTAAVTIASVVLSGTNASEFTMTNGCSTSLAASASCNITVKASPLTAGSKTATVTVTDSAANTLSATVTATATGNSASAAPTGTTMSNEGGGGSLEALFAALIACATIALARNRAFRSPR